jgi:hypothetical protein
MIYFIMPRFKVFHTGGTSTRPKRGIPPFARPPRLSTRVAMYHQRVRSKNPLDLLAILLSLFFLLTPVTAQVNGVVFTRGVTYTIGFFNTLTANDYSSLMHYIIISGATVTVGGTLPTSRATSGACPRYFDSLYNAREE